MQAYREGISSGTDVKSAVHLYKYHLFVFLEMFSCSLL